VATLELVMVQRGELDVQIWMSFHQLRHRCCTWFFSVLRNLSSFLYFVYDFILTSCRRATATICPRPSPPLWAPKRLAPPSRPRLQCRPQRSSRFPRPVRSHPQRCSCLTWVKRPGDLDLWPFDLESGVRVTCDVGYLCVNFSLPRFLCSRLRPDVRDRRRTDRQTSDSIIA